MATQVGSIPTVLGTLRKGLIDEGYTSDQAFWIVQDLIRSDALIGD
jgi:hypothetical protein